MESPPRTKRAAPSLPAAPIKKTKKEEVDLTRENVTKNELFGKVTREDIRNTIKECTGGGVEAFADFWNIDSIYEIYEDETLVELEKFVKRLDDLLNVARTTYIEKNSCNEGDK